jgi:phenylalanyl-tRNA synthetase alpha chain
MVDFEINEREYFVLTQEGQELADGGSHEAKVFNAVPAGEEGIAISDIQVNFLFFDFRNYVNHLVF